MQNIVGKVNRISPRLPNESQRNRSSPNKEIDGSSCASATCSLTSITSVIPHHPDSNYSSHGESLELLKDRIKKRQSEIKKAFDMFRLSEQHHHILKTHFRLALDTFCFPLSDTQFQDITSKFIQPSDAIINYDEFLKHYGNNDHQEVATIEKIEYSTLEEIEVKIHITISRNIKAVCLAFRLFDHNQDGNIHLYELQKVIENFCGLKLSKESYQRLWSRYDQRDSGLIDYQEFLKKLALNTSQYQKCLPNLNMKIALTWPDANLENYNKQKQRLALLNHSDDPILKGLPLQQIEDLLRGKIISEYKVLKRAFLILDSKGSGTVPYNYFRSTLIHFTYPMSQQLFSQMMQRMGIKQSERVCWTAFLHHVCKQTPESHIQNSSDSTQWHRNRGSTTSHTFSKIVIKLSKIGIQPGISTLRSFNLQKRLNGQDDLFITRQELRLMIERKGNSLSENEMKDLMVALDPGHTNFISYSKFCTLFGFDKADRNKCISEPANEPCKCQPKSSRLQTIPWSKLLGKLKSKVHKKYDIIEKSLGACDYEQKGWIHGQQLRQVLHKFCFRVTDSEFERILQMADAVDDIVNIRRFLDTFRETEKERLQNWSAVVSQLSKTSSPKPWSEKLLNVFLQELLIGDRQNFLNSFQLYDVQGRGTLTKEDVAKVIHKHMGRLSESEFEIIWRKLPIDKYGLFEYVSFFESHDDECTARPETSRSQATNGSLASRRLNTNHIKDEEDNIEAQQTILTHQSPVTLSSRISSEQLMESIDYSITGSRKPSPRKGPTSAVSNTSKMGTELRPIISVISILKTDIHLHKVLARKWRDIKLKCSILDTANTGIISSSQFLEILSKSGIPVSTKPVLHLLQSKYNLCLHGPVSYINFLRDIFLTTGNPSADFLKLQSSPGSSFPEDTPHFYSILLELRTPVLSKWKRLQKAFRRHDVLGNGCVPFLKFRKILQEFGISLTNEDFHKLTYYFDSRTTGTISYKEFMSVFMKSVK